MPRYRIFPSIGIARLGEDENYFIGPEVVGHGPTELDGAPVRQFKSADHKKIRKQGARFHLFESDDGLSWMPAQIPAGARIEWTVQLANKKAAVKRDGAPSQQHARPEIDEAHARMSIETLLTSISGKGQTSAEMSGIFEDMKPTSGEIVSATVLLGTLKTDAEGRLIVLGGRGRSESPAGRELTGSFYNNPGWFDDVADGPVSATVRSSANEIIGTAEDGAWVIVAPPDFAPDIAGIVRLWDVLREVGGVVEPDEPSFDRTIAPLVARARLHRWVHASANWKDGAAVNWGAPELGNKKPEDRPKREEIARRIRRVQELLDGNAAGPGQAPYRLTAEQEAILNAWTTDKFDNSPATMPSTITAEGLTESSLAGAVGQAFFPGIEAGVILRDPTLYVSPFDFRLSHAQVKMGDITALMAQPWQADFLDCVGSWWPTQRPDLARKSGNLSDNTRWDRNIIGHAGMVANFQRLGFIVRSDAEGVFVEKWRDESLDQPDA